MRVQAEVALTQNTDSIGKASFGQVEVCEGSGRVARGGSQSAAELQMMLLVPSRHLNNVCTDRCGPPVILECHYHCYC